MAAGSPEQSAGKGVVMGIGGLFIRSRDPDRLAQWYRDMLGVGPGCAAAGEPSQWAWRTEGGDVVFQPFAHDNDYFAADKAFMLNLRVAGLDALIGRLEDAGLAVEQREEWNSPEAGQFARIADPDGNPVELWQPAD